MSDRKVSKFDEPKDYIDDVDIWDVIDDLRRYMDRLKETIKKQRNQLDQNIDLMEYQRVAYVKLEKQLRLELVWAERE